MHHRYDVLLKYALGLGRDLLLPPSLGSFGPSFHLNSWGQRMLRGESWDPSKRVVFETLLLGWIGQVGLKKCVQSSSEKQSIEGRYEKKG